MTEKEKFDFLEKQYHKILNLFFDCYYKNISEEEAVKRVRELREETDQTLKNLEKKDDYGGDLVARF